MEMWVGVFFWTQCITPKTTERKQELKTQISTFVSKRWQNALHNIPVISHVAMLVAGIEVNICGFATISSPSVLV